MMNKRSNLNRKTNRLVARFPIVFYLFSMVGCSILGRSDRGPGSLVPTRHQARTGPFVVWSNAPILNDDPALEGLRALSKSIETTLGVRVPEKAAAIETYILDDKESFQHFLMFYHPDCPPRRAFFVERGNKLEMYAYRQPRLVEDLRHEATHALLHAAIGDLPLWLDEGLAEYFEVPDARRGLNAEHVSRLPLDIADGWAPDLTRLESLDNARDMSPRDYREAWAWVHSMLDSPPRKAVLISYLNDLHSGSAQANSVSVGSTGAIGPSRAFGGGFARTHSQSYARSARRPDRPRTLPTIALPPSVSKTPPPKPRAEGSSAAFWARCSARPIAERRLDRIAQSIVRYTQEFGA